MTTRPTYEELEQRIKVLEERVKSDITEHKRTENALRQSEEQLNRISAATFEAIIIHEGGILISANDQYYEMFGYEPGELMGKQTLQLTIAPETIHSTRKKIETCSLGPYESIGLKKDGSRFPIEIRVREWEYEGRKVRAAAIMDITERKHAEEVLQFEREQLLSIFDSIDEIIYVTDLDTYEILYANKTLKDAFQKNIIGGVCYREFQGLDSPCPFCTNNIIRKQKYAPHNWEYRNPVLNRDYAIIDRIIKWPDGRDVRFELAIDITERKRAEEMLQRYNQRLMILHQIDRDILIASSPKTIVDTTLKHISGNCP